MSETEAKQAHPCRKCGVDATWKEHEDSARRDGKGYWVMNCDCEELDEATLQAPREAPVDQKSIMTPEQPWEELARSLPPVSAEEVLPSVLSAMERAQAELAFRQHQATLVRHVVVSMGGPEVTEGTIAGAWMRIEEQVRGGLGMAPPAAPAREPWEYVEDWLVNLDHRVIEQLWIGNTNYAKSNSQAVREGLIELLRKEVQDG